MKKTIKKILIVLLAMTLLLSLAACGKKPEGNSDPQSQNPDLASSPSDENGNHPQFVYTSEFFPVKDSAKYGLRVLNFTDDGVFCMGYEPLPDGTPADYCGTNNTDAVLAFIDYEGNMQLLSDYAPVENSEGADMPDYTKSARLSEINPLSDGSYVFIEEQHYGYYTGPEGVDRETDWETYYSNYQNFSKFYYRHIDGTGKDLGSCEINTDSSPVMVYSTAADKEGNIYFNNDTKVYKVASDGTVTTVLDGDNYISELLNMPDGSIILNIMNEGGGPDVYRRLDVATGALGEEFSGPAGGFYGSIPASGDYDLYFSSGSGFYGFKFGSEAAERIFSWIDCDMSSNMGSMNVGVRSNGDVVILNSQFCTDNPADNEIAVIRKKSWEEVPHKKTLTLGTLGMNLDIEKAVLNFNRSNDKYRIQVVNYADDADYAITCDSSSFDFYENGRTKFMTAIMAGDVPDIISLQSMPFKQLAAKGILEDMSPWLEKDGAFDRDDIVPSALKAMEIDGKLYRVFPSFSIRTAVGAGSVVGEDSSWSYSRFKEALAQMPEGCLPMETYVNRESIMNISLTLDMDSYVNWETGECNFERPEFKEFLDYLMLFPTREELEQREYTPEDDKAFAKGLQLLSDTNVNSVKQFKTDNFHRTSDAQQISYIGFPSISGNGTVLSADSGVAMTAKCSDKDGAWEFIRNYLSEDFQKNAWGLPTNMKLLNAQISEAMQPVYEKDENGQYILDENGEKIKKSEDAYYTFDCTEIPVYEMTEEQEAVLRSIIDKGGVVDDDNSAIIKIVYEELQPYFAGQKSAEDVAKLIQSKVNLYVNEQK